MRSSSLALLTDLYQLTMAQGYWKSGMARYEGVFYLFFRQNPFKGGFTLACGLEEVIRYLQEFRFEESDLNYLASLKGNDEEPLFGRDFLAYLKNLRFSCSLHAVPEGSVVFPHEPVLRVQGPLIQAQILETPLLNILNFQSLVATKAARVCRAARGRPVLEFGLRRAQGPNGGLSASRAAYIGGCAATSNLLAGKIYGIPVKGTHAHSWVMAFHDELDAFIAYAEAMPNNCVFLVDTYNSLQGVKHAIEVGRRLRLRGFDMVGIRLDSGNLAGLSRQARRLLDEAGFPQAKIVASNDLDEYRIEALHEAGAVIDIYGVGTRLATAYEQPALGGVYKLAALRPPGGQWQYKMKLSEQPLKTSTPGILQVRRFWGENGYEGDLIYNELWPGFQTHFSTFDGRSCNFAHLSSKDLLMPVFEHGKQVYMPIDIHHTRAFASEQLALLPDKYRQLRPAAVYAVGLEPRLKTLKEQLLAEVSAREINR